MPLKVYNIRENIMLDYLQAVFWSLTYVILIIYAMKFKKHGIPLLAILLNFAWETVALINSIQKMQITGPLIIHLAWFSLDFIIVVLYLCEKNSSIKQKLMFGLGYAISTAFLVFLFEYGYMLLSCFCIDLIMAITFLVFLLFHRVYKHWLSYLIAITKLLGDMFAWQFYKSVEVINIIGILVLICNITYLIILIYKKTNDGLLENNFSFIAHRSR